MSEVVEKASAPLIQKNTEQVLGRLLVGLPLAHLIFASTYLYAYCVGFGAGVASFISVNDVFATSIRDLAPLYVSAIGIVLLASRQEIVLWLTTGSVRRPEQYGPSRPYWPVKVPRWGRMAAYATIFLTGSGALITHLTGGQMQVGHSILLSLSMLLITTGPRLSFTTPALAAILVATAVVTALAVGADAGQTDRHESYKTLSRHNPHCEEIVVLRRFSDLYLAIEPQGKRILTDNNCKPQFDIPEPKPLVPPERLWPPIRAFFVGEQDSGRTGAPDASQSAE